MDWMGYLWVGNRSPVSGRLVKTFERSYIEDQSTWAEPMDPYFELTRDAYACDAIMREFGLVPGYGHIINGHTPVKTLKGESPLRAEGRLLVIDGGFLPGIPSQDRHRRLYAHLQLTRHASQGARSIQKRGGSADAQCRHPKRDHAGRCRLASHHGLRHDTVWRYASASTTCASCSKRTDPASYRSMRASKRTQSRQSAPRIAFGGYGGASV